MIESSRRGVIMAGGSGTRLYPLTQAMSKQLLPVYDKPMIYYPLSILMLTGIREIMVICGLGDEARFRELLGDGSQWGIRIEYAIQERPEGLAQGLIIADGFLAGGPSCFILGDNILHGPGLTDLLQMADRRSHGATIFGYWVSDPERYGVAEFDHDGQIVGIEEKPTKARSNYAVVGLYFYDGRASGFARTLVPSGRGELEITDLNRMYLADGSLEMHCLRRGYAWLDAGTVASLMEASSYIQTIEARQGLRVCCPEEVAFNNGWIDAGELAELGTSLRKSEYGQYLLALSRRR